MDEDEMLEAGMELDRNGRWRIAISEADWRRLGRLREAA